MSSNDGSMVVNSVSYDTVKRIGKGKNSRVYEAIDTRTNSAVAIKVEDFIPKKKKLGFEFYLDQFLMETNSLDSLRWTRSVVDLYDFDINMSAMSGSIVMELGHPLLSNMRRVKAISEPRRGLTWSGVIRAVAAVHRGGIIHADIKPSNFVLTSTGVKLIDFAYSLFVGDRDQVIKNYYRGTLDFVSPEVLMAKPYGNFCSRTDVWSLGCMLHEFTFGRSYFDRLQMTFARDKPNFILNSMSKLSIPAMKNRDLENLMHYCLQLSPYDRPSSEQLLFHNYTLISTHNALNCASTSDYSDDNRDNHMHTLYTV